MSPRYSYWQEWGLKSLRTLALNVCMQFLLIGFYGINTPAELTNNGYSLTFTAFRKTDCVYRLFTMRANRLFYFRIFWNFFKLKSHIMLLYAVLHCNYIILFTQNCTRKILCVVNLLVFSKDLSKKYKFNNVRHLVFHCKNNIVML